MLRMEIQPLLTKWHIRMSQEEILQRWQEPHRAYHTRNHLEDLLQQIRAISKNHITDKYREMLLLTAVFHDIVYDPRRKDNEERSAKLLLENAPETPEIQYIVSIIHDTKTHKPKSPLSHIFCDLDMSIVKKPLPDLVQWESGIRYEYKHVPKFLYIIGRVRFLRQMIKRYPENTEALKSLIRTILPWYIPMNIF
jgi:pantetheine-phosphate adenylyltransferase